MLATEITQFRQVHIAFPLISQKKVQFLVLFYLFGAISLYILVEGVPPRPTLTALLCTPPIVSMPGILCLYEKRNGDAAKQVLQHLRINSGL